MEYTCKQTHVHEFQTTTEIHEDHVHQIVGVSGMVIPMANGHVHELVGHSTFKGGMAHADGHIHPYYLISGPAVAVSAEAHVHYVEGLTAMVDGHTHQVELTTFQIETGK